MSIPLVSCWQYPFHVSLTPSLRSSNFADLLSLVMCTNEGKDEILQNISTCGLTRIFRTSRIFVVDMFIWFKIRNSLPLRLATLATSGMSQGELFEINLSLGNI